MRDFNDSIEHEPLSRLKCCVKNDEPFWKSFIFLNRDSHAENFFRVFDSTLSLTADFYSLFGFNEKLKGHNLRILNMIENKSDRQSKKEH
jgi:hypothetical protein